MKKSLFLIQPYFILGFLATLFFTSCEKETILPQEDASIQEAQLLNAPEIDDMPAIQLLGTIETQGHTLFFDAVGDEIVIREKLPATSEDPVSLLDQYGDEFTPFDVFEDLTDASTPIPALIANTSKVVTSRMIDQNNNLFTFSENNQATLENRGCYDEGYSGFRSKRCGITSSTPSDIRFCDNGKWTSLIRNSYYGGSWRTVKKVDTWTNVICGLTTLKYFYHSNGAWHQYYSAQLQNGIWRVVRFSSTLRLRKVTRSSNNKSFRAYTRFYK